MVIEIARKESCAKEHFWRVFLAWMAASAALHLFWELAQLPLYAISLNADKGYVAFAILHCTAGDALLSIATYLGASIAARDLSWPVTHTWRGAAVALPLGVLYTAGSEWHNVYHSSWAYLARMPLVFGVGVTPMLQWLIVPMAALFLMRRLHTRAVLKP